MEDNFTIDDIFQSAISNVQYDTGIEYITTRADSKIATLFEYNGNLYVLSVQEIGSESNG